VAAIEIGRCHREDRPGDAVGADNPVVERGQAAVGDQVRPRRRHRLPIGRVPVNDDQPGGRPDLRHLCRPVAVQRVHPR